MKGYLQGLVIALSASSIFIISSCKKEEAKVEEVEQQPITPVVEQINFASLADKTQQSMVTQFWSTQKYYNQNNNGHVGFNYWWHAHILDVLVDGYVRTKDPQYLTRMKDLMDGVKAKNGNTYRNNFYDDMEWMALACLRAYDATKDEFYKTTAKQLWGWIKQGWTPVKNGGIMWESNSPNSKNACSNAPASIIASRLYQLEKNPEDLEWAKKIYEWLKAYVVESNRALVWDAYGNTNEGNIYTYNQGTYIGAGVELYQITKDKAYIAEAVRNAGYLLNDKVKFSPSGILRGENTGDGGLFKGIFIRYLTQLIEKGDLDEETKKAFVKYMKDNGESLAVRAIRKPEYIFGHDWRTMPEDSKSDLSVHLSGIMLLESVNELQRLGILK